MNRPRHAAFTPVLLATLATLQLSAPQLARAAEPGPATPSPTPRRTTLSPGEALVHVAVTYPSAWLETRNYVDGGPFQRACPAPCDLSIAVVGREARVVAPGMTPSNNFRFDSGVGVAGLRVDGGSARARRAGIVTLAAGIPLALAGLALFALGRIKEKTSLQAAGIAGLSVGGLGVAVSLPLLFMGSTHVKDSKGSSIALAPINEPSL
jgi:hypothetical protein